MAAPNPYDKYLANTISTASKEELTLMLYDGALKFCNQSIAALEDKDLVRSSALNIRTQNIIREFQLTLNHKYAISRDFNLMYDYIFRRLVDANIKKDVAILQECRGLIKELRDTWKEAMLIARTQKDPVKKDIAKK